MRFNFWKKNTKKDLKSFFKKKGEVDIPYHWALALIIFFVFGGIMVVMAGTFFFQIGDRTVFVDGSNSVQIQNIDTNKLKEVLDYYSHKERQFLRIQQNSITLEAPTQPEAQTDEQESEDNELQ